MHIQDEKTSPEMPKKKAARQRCEVCVVPQLGMSRFLAALRLEI